MTDLDEIRSWPALQRQRVSVALFEWSNMLLGVQRGFFGYAAACMTGARRQVASLRKRQRQQVSRAKQTAKTKGSLTASAFKRL